MMKRTLDLIGHLESRGQYDAVFGGIKGPDRPLKRTGKRLTELTVYEVLQWQDSIDHMYRSEAAGKFQVMEDTLRELVAQGRVDGNSLFNKETQDRVALILMKRRGLPKFLKGDMATEIMANNLAMEWASLPVCKEFTRGGKLRRYGYSYYAGDGLNKCLTDPEEVLEALARDWNDHEEQS